MVRETNGISRSDLPVLISGPESINCLFDGLSNASSSALRFILTLVAWRRAGDETVEQDELSVDR